MYSLMETGTVNRVTSPRATRLCFLSLNSESKEKDSVQEGEGQRNTETMKWNKSNRHMLYLVPFALPAFFPFLLSFPILMSTTAFYRGMVPVWYITGRTHTGERGQDSSRVTAMLAERLGVLRQARWFRVWAKEHHHIMLRRKKKDGRGTLSLPKMKI